MTRTTTNKLLIGQLAQCLYLTELSEFDAAMTRIGATIPGKQREFYHNGNHCDIVEVVQNLLTGEEVKFGPLILVMSESMDELVVTVDKDLEKSFRPDLITGFQEHVRPKIDAACALVIQTARNYEKPFDYR